MNRVVARLYLPAIGRILHFGARLLAKGIAGVDGAKAHDLFVVSGYRLARRDRAQGVGALANLEVLRGRGRGSDHCNRHVDRESHHCPPSASKATARNKCFIAASGSISLFRPDTAELLPCYRELIPCSVA